MPQEPPHAEHPVVAAVLVQVESHPSQLFVHPLPQSILHDAPQLLVQFLPQLFVHPDPQVVAQCAPQLKVQLLRHVSVQSVHSGLYQATEVPPQVLLQVPVQILLQPVAAFVVAFTAKLLLFKGTDLP